MVSKAYQTNCQLLARVKQRQSVLLEGTNRKRYQQGSKISKEFSISKMTAVECRYSFHTEAKLDNTNSYDFKTLDKTILKCRKILV